MQHNTSMTCLSQQYYLFDTNKKKLLTGGMSLANRFKKAREAGLPTMTQGRLAELLMEKTGEKVTQQALQQIENGLTKASKFIEPICQILSDFLKKDIKPGWMMYGEGLDPFEKVSELYSQIPKGSIPILEWDQVEIYIDPSEDASKIKITGYTNNPQTKIYKDLFALRVKGDSMIGQPKSFNPGSLIFVYPRLDPRDGDYVVVHDEDPETKEAVLRKLIIEGGKMLISALNPMYGPVKDFSNYHFIGTVIAHVDILRD